MNAALVVEALKLRRSPVGLLSTCALLAGTLLLLGGITAAVADGNPQIIAKAGPAASLDWSGLTAGAAQITSAGALLTFGVVLAWMFGREFAARTRTGLFTLPVSRGRIALAKLVVYAGWVLLVSITLPLGVLVLGLLLGYGHPEPEVWRSIARLCLLAALTGAAATPVAWVTTLARSLLAGVGATILLVVVAQVGVLAGSGGWLPLAAPAVWALTGGQAVDPAQLALTVALALASATLTGTAWTRLQLDR